MRDEVEERIEARRREIEASERAAVEAEVAQERAAAERRSEQVPAIRDAQERAHVAVEAVAAHAVKLAALAQSVAACVKAMQGLKGELDRGVAFEAYALRASQAPPAGQHRCFQGIPSPSHAAARAAPPSLGKVSICPAK